MSAASLDPESSQSSSGYEDGLGRNAGFYSICALMRSNHTATEDMLRSYRLLIQHLRQEAPRTTGTRILPHSSGYDTECPGNLTMYAQPGSTRVVTYPGGLCSASTTRSVSSPTRRPSTLTCRRPGWMRRAGQRTISPSTLTRPASIQRSASAREHTPNFERARASESGPLVLTAYAGRSARAKVI